MKFIYRFVFLILLFLPQATCAGSISRTFWLQMPISGAKKIAACSPNRIFYFFAESKSYAWKGTDNTRTIDGKKYRMRMIELKTKDKGKPKYYKLK